MKPVKIALTGASGFIGSHLRKRFKDHIVILRHDSIEEIQRKLEDVEVVVNLAGASILKRWTPAYKQVLWDSRILTTRKVVAAVNQSPVSHLISTSAVGIYPDGVECQEECTSLSQDFLGSLAKAWEEEALQCRKRVTVLRFGIILGKDGGALKKMLLPFKLGLGGPIGDGSMVMSWLDINDLMEVYQFVIERELEGIINAVSPQPVTNLEFTKALAHALKRPAFIPVPKLALRLLYGEAAQVMTSSKIAIPARLAKEGFQFRYGDIKESMLHLFH